MDYIKLKSTFDVCETLWEESADCLIMAGGTDLLMRPDSFANRHIVLDISRIDDLSRIGVDGDDWLVVGAAVTHQRIADDRMLSHRAHLLGLACGSIGSYQIRNLGTIGGNLGNASPAGDSLPALACLDALVEVASKDGHRLVGIVDLFSGPGGLNIEPYELISSIRIPVRKGRGVAFFKKIGQRQGMSCAKASVAFYATRHADGRLTGVRMSMGAVAPTVVVAKQAQRILEGRVLTPQLIDEASEACKLAAQPIDDIRSNAQYRLQAVSALAAEGLHEALEHIQNFQD